MSQPAENLKSLFTGLDVTAATSGADLVIDELDRWTTSDMPPMALSEVCWAPPTPAIISELPHLERVV